jgi:hypothetical protein
MKTALTTLVVCAALVVGAAAYQSQQTASQTPPKTPPDVTLTGCLLQGSAPDVFIFDNARLDAKSKTEKGVRYLIAINAEDLNLRPHLNHEVEMVGQIELKTPPPPGQKVEEKDLSVFKTKSVTMVSDTCAMAAIK